ncbi:J517_1871 family lipoprotein [Acinetobacter bereziniae]|uniref:J517_1871 family lipoprotein n=1 Tax=Acinetobacter bereziniae TaxID=106648 RepID=UPI003AF4950E
MRIIALGLGIVFGLTGCVSPVTEMTNNNFTNVQATNKTLNGVWSGNNGPYLVTIKFNGDGTGLMCASYNGKDTLEKFKVNDRTVYMQNGLKQTIVNHTDSLLALKVSYLGGATYQYKPDNSLLNASPYCEKEFK